jgi:glycerol-3-phosphate dehydrogenase
VLTEQRDVNSGASGANHGLLHSGARYVQSDPHSAAQCAGENAIIKRIAPQCVEDCGGIFAALPGDDEAYSADFPARCRAAGVFCEELSVSLAREKEPALSERIVRAFAVRDASVDPFMLSWENIAAATELGATFLPYHRLETFERDAGRLNAAELRNARTGAKLRIEAEHFAVCAGAWSAHVAALAGCSLAMRLSRGTLLITQTRVASRVINRLRPPSDGDLLVPGGSVSILGTTSVQVESPEHAFPTPAEVDVNLKEGLALLPRLAATPFLRAYAGIRPLLQASGGSRELSRDFLLDTHEHEGLSNLLTLTGGKLTTYRLMAERAADLLCERLRVRAPCRTAELPLRPSRLAKWTDPGLVNKYRWWNRHTPGDSLMCECEIIPREAVDGILPELRETGLPLLDVSARSRLGKGACQGTFCAARLTAYLHDRGIIGGEAGREGLKAFLQERWKGQRPILWGAQCAQAELKEALYLGFLRLGE